MEDVLYVASPYAPWTFLALTIVVGGAAGWASGRALALTWRPMWRALPAALALAAVVGFLHYVLFHETPISLARIAAALAARDPVALALALQFYGVMALVVLAAAIGGHAVSRARQMRRQYGALSGR